MDQEWLNNVKAVGFDLDGTLYPPTEKLSKWIQSEILNQLWEELGGKREEVEKRYHEKRSELGSSTKTMTYFGIDGVEVFNQIWSDMELGQFLQRDPALVKQLGRLRERYQLFLISNGRGIEVEMKLEYLEIPREWFDPLIACYDHETVKPEPTAYLMALDKLGMMPEEVLFVGDRVATDIEGARAVGMRTMLVYGENEIADVSATTIGEGMELILS